MTIFRYTVLALIAIMFSGCNSSGVTQGNSIDDAKKPVITLLGAPTINLTVGDTYKDAGATATDKVDGDITKTILKVGSVDTSAEGNYTITYDVTNTKGYAATQVDRTVEVTTTAIKDTTSPIITLIGSETVTHEMGTTYADAGATATDNADGNITKNIVTVGSVNTRSEGNYTLKHNVTDTAGNAATVDRTVEVTAQKAEIRIACVGDSLTQGYPNEKNRKESYPVQLGTLVPTGTKVKNFGINNKTALNKKNGGDDYRLTTEYADSKEYKPNKVVIMFGTNDIKNAHWDKKEKFIADYTALIKTYQDLPSKPQIYICLPTPSFDHPWKASGITEDRIKNELIPKIKEVASSMDLLLIDLHEEFKDKENLFHDGLHPTKEGSKAMADFILGKIY